MPNDMIFYKGDNGHEMYFIKKGKVLIILDESDETKNIPLNEGTFFGEKALLYESKRLAGAKAGTFCVLLLLER